MMSLWGWGWGWQWLHCWQWSHQEVVVRLVAAVVRLVVVVAHSH